MRPDALHNLPSVVSPQVAGADGRTGLHITSSCLAISGFFANHFAIDASELVERFPAPADSAFCTIGLGGSGREQFVAAVNPVSTPNPITTCFSRFTPLVASDYHLMTSHSESSAVACGSAWVEELLRCGCSGGVLLDLGCLIRLFARQIGQHKLPQFH